MLIVLVSHHIGQSSNIIFSDLLSDNSVCALSVSLKDWLDLQRNLLHSHESNVFSQLLMSTPRWMYQDYKITINYIFYSLISCLEATYSN